VDAWLTQARVALRYLGLLALPLGQTVDHGVLPSRSLAEPATLAALAALAALLGGACWLVVRARPRPDTAWGAAGRAAGFGVAWFALLLLPSSLVPLADPMAEHRLYLPAWGLFLAAVVAAEAALAGRLPAAARGALAGGLLVLLALASWSRNGAWETRVALWSSAVEATPGRARPHQNLGYAWMVRGQHERAIGEYRAALDLGPDRRLAAEILRNLGSALAQLGRHDEAGQALAAAAQHPDVEASARTLRAMSLVQLGLFGPARQEVTRALQLEPDDTAARNTLGQVLLGTGDPAGAAEQFRLAIRANPDAAVQHFNLALALGRQGRAAEACTSWQRYLGLEPDPQVAARRWPDVRAFGCAPR
jgi:tetratricopeptide (TPR) repeat protein